MRFAIAASILAAQLIPTAATEAQNPKNTLASFKADLKEKNELQQIHGKDALNEHYRSSIDGLDSFKRNNQNGRLTNQKSPIMVAETNADGSVAIFNKECDPDGMKSNQSVYKQEADIGILTCGEDEYCMESEYATFGGFCVPGNGDSIQQQEQRRRQQDHEQKELWNRHYEYNFDDGDGIHEQQQHGRRELQSSSEPQRFCFRGFSGVGCETFHHCVTNCEGTDEMCFSARFDYGARFSPRLGAMGNRYSLCYQITEPFETEICYSQTNIYRIECSVTYDGIPCDSCVISDQDCLYFDCRNIEGPFGQGSIGTTCDENGTCNVNRMHACVCV